MTPAGLPHKLIADLPGQNDFKSAMAEAIFWQNQPSMNSRPNVLLLVPQGMDCSPLLRLVAEMENLPMIEPDLSEYIHGSGAARKPAAGIVAELLRERRVSPSGPLGIVHCKNMERLLDDVAGEQFQNPLAELAHGKPLNVALGGHRTIETQRILWLASIRTTNRLGKLLDVNQETVGLGFQASRPAARAQNHPGQALIDAGFSHGFCNGFDLQARLTPPTAAEFAQMRESRLSGVDVVTKAFESAGIKLDITNNAWTVLANLAAEQGLDWSGPGLILRRHLSPLVMQLPEMTGKVQQIHVDADSLLNKTAPQLVFGPPLLASTGNQHSSPEMEFDREHLSPEEKTLFPVGTLPKRPAYSRSSNTSSGRYATIKDLAHWLA
jgi:hypothetical protein